MLRKLSLVAVLVAALPVLAADPAKSDPAAEKLMKDAHDSRSSWDSSFPGFTAKVWVGVDGQTAEGKLTVAPDGKLQLDLAGAALNEFATHNLKSIVSHRFASDRKYNVAFADKEMNHPLGRLINFLDSKNQYRIKDDLITEVHREMGKGKFTITATEIFRTSEGKQLPKAFSVSYWDSEGNLARNEDYQEEWVRVGKYDLPKRRLVIRTAKGERSVGELRLSDLKLLPATASK